MADILGRGKKPDFSLKHKSVNSKEIWLSFQHGCDWSPCKVRDIDETVKGFECHAKGLEVYFTGGHI